MGQDLLISLVEIRPGKKPNFFRAKMHLKKLTDEDVRHAMDVACGRDNLDDEEMVDARKRIESAYASVEEGWRGNLRNMMRVNATATDMLIAGGVSWGDSIEELDDINLFVESGGARAAGFLMKQMALKPMPAKKRRTK